MLSNQFDDAASRYDATKNDAKNAAKVLQVFADKPYSRRYKLANNAAQLVAFICNLFSFATFGFLLGFLIYSLSFPMLGASGLWLAFPLATLIAVCFELVKNAAAANFFVGLFKFKNVTPTALIAVLLLALASIAGSFAGSKILPDVTIKDTLKYDFSSFDAQKLELNNQIKAAQIGSTYKGILTKQGHAQISKIQLELAQLAKEREKYSQQIDKEKSIFADEKSSITSYLVYFSVASELVFILCYAFSFYYLYRCFVELNLSDNPNNADFIPMQLKAFNTQNTVQITPQITPLSVPNSTPDAIPNQPPTTRKIGFILGENLSSPDTISSPDAISSPDKVVSKYGIGTCKNCSCKFHKNSFNHKFCSDACKLENWEKTNGIKFVPTKKRK